MWYRRILFLCFIGSLILCITGISIMPPTGGAVPMYESPEKFYQDQRTMILNSIGFKLAMAGAAITILMLILLIRNYLIQEAIAEAREARETREARVVPYPNIQASQVKPQEKLVELREVIVVPEVQHITHELTPIQALVPNVPMAATPGPRVATPGPRVATPGPRGPILLRTFKYPPPYEAFNKK